MPADPPFRPAQIRQGKRAAPIWATAAVLLVSGLAGCGQEAASSTVPDSRPSQASSPFTAGQAASTPDASNASASETAKPTPTATRTKTAKAEPEKASAGTALAQLETIEIKGRAPRTGYDRDLFGSGWLDPDRNGCDARNDILARDLTKETFRPGTHNCVVTSGTLADPYTATTIDFVRGNATSILVQIDHVVPLSDAWQKGARQLAPNQREAFANDPLNLLAVDGPTNMAKSDSDAATWLPPNRAFRCEYVALQTAVKAKHGLWMTQAEHDAIERILTSSCPEQPVPDDDGGVTVPAAVKQSAPAPKAVPEPKVPDVQEPATGSVFYQNCTAVRAAGAAPIRAGDPGWEMKFDRDGDGVGCEP
ncbi:DUF1524 domain-containing protein [Arthrobacter sp. GCM10027362]|uniref:GmrSD restriction endonuclease domain-containing protein n=1 Tax=Arthrobacter sp. GCM10027362 TaxID=3273379 RepID=UPI003626FCD5